MKPILSLFLCTVIFSCSTPIKDESKQDQCTKYACPMHPDKTSTKPDACPECNMEMKIVPDSVATDSTVVQSCCKMKQESKS